MIEWYYYVIGGVVALIVAFLVEDSRDFLVEAFEYIISFEFLEDIGEFFSTIFEGISEFSIYGIVFGALTTIALYLLSDWTLAPFLAYYTPTGKIVWGAITYVGTFISGYMMGVYYENS